MISSPGSPRRKSRRSSSFCGQYHSQKELRPFFFLALVRKLALTLLKRHPLKQSIACKRLHAALDVDFLEAVVRQSVNL